MTHRQLPVRADDYGEHNAAFYDEIYPSFDPRAAACLQSLAGDGRVLELGVGSGRCAVVLAAAGLDVTGIDASKAMLARCRARDPGRRIALLRGDLAALPFRGGFTLALSLVDTLSLLPGRDAQARCLRGIGAALDPGGSLVHEGSAHAVAGDQPTLHEIAWQGATQGSYRFTALGLPPELLDPMAAAAGLALQARWSDWRRTAWRAGAVNAISWYRRLG